MKEETLLILKHINNKINEVKEECNLDENTCFIIPIGSRADYGYITHEMIKDILQIQERIDKAIEWIYIVQQNKDNKHLEPIICTDELDGVLEILKGGKE